MLHLYQTTAEHHLRSPACSKLSHPEPGAQPFAARILPGNAFSCLSGRLGQSSLACCNHAQSRAKTRKAPLPCPQQKLCTPMPQIPSKAVSAPNPSPIPHTFSPKRANHPRKQAGFTFIEILLVVMIIGILLAVILPRAQRAQIDAKYSIVRQHATELSSYVSLWTQNRQEAKQQSSSWSAFQTLTMSPDSLGSEQTSLATRPLVDRYTGSQSYQEQIAPLISRGNRPENPFNNESYFSQANNDDQAPSSKPGLLYLTFSPDDPETEDPPGAFYFIFTAYTDDDAQPAWYGEMGTSQDQSRRGIFVMRVFQ